MGEDLKFLIIFVIGLLGIAFIITIAEGEYTCGNYEEMSGRKTKYLWLDECYVKTDSGYQRWDEYTARATASEGLK